MTRGFETRRNGYPGAMRFEMPQPPPTPDIPDPAPSPDPVPSPQPDPPSDGADRACVRRGRPRVRLNAPRSG